MTRATAHRREFLKLAASAAAAACCRGAAAMSRPNVIVILADDMGFGDLACQNPNSEIPTPYLDRLAGQGRRFTDAHAPSSVCSPTRYALLTGRYAWRGDLRSSVLWPWDRELIEAGRLTLPELLRRAGYRTDCVGKWHLGWGWATKDGRQINDTVPLAKSDNAARVAFNDNIDFTRPMADGPTARGFETYFGDDVPNFPPYTFIENDRVTVQPTEEKPQGMFGHAGPMAPGWQLEAVMPTITQRAVDTIERHAAAQEPFFLYFALTAPHTPIVPLGRFKGASGAGDYGDYVVEVDWAVGEILAALDRAGIADDTLLVFTSDNGPENSAYKRIQEDGHYSMGELRGVKRDTWEGGHRVPFVCRWPGHVPTGTTCDETICLTDLMASLAALLDLALPNDAAEDSFNVLPALLGQPHNQPLREATVHHASNAKLAIRQGDWVYIDATSGDANKEPGWFRKQHGVVDVQAPAELFNLAEDPGERRNRYHDEPERVEALKTLLERYRAEERSAPPRG